MECQIVIYRDRAAIGCALRHTVELDGLTVGVLENGGTLSVPVSAGAHTITFLARGGKPVKELRITVDQEFPVVELFVRLNNYLKPEVSMGGRAQQVVRRRPVKEEALRRKGRTALKVAGVLIVLAVIINMFGSDPSSDPKSTGAPSSSAPTAEELASAELEKASEKFRRGDYMAAVEICSGISDDYPDTQAAAGMDEYLSGQYATFPHMSATELMSAYDANVVNADKEYMNSVLVVSGTVSSIGKTNGGSNLTVLLDSGNSLFHVQLNFKKSQTDAVAALSNGDPVTAIGKCTGKSGKIFVVLDGSNIMLEDCLLIPG